MFQIQNLKVKRNKIIILEKTINHLVFKCYFNSLFFIILDLIFTLTLRYIEIIYVKEDKRFYLSLLKFLIIFFIIFSITISLLLLIKNSFFSKILTYIYIGINGLYILVIIIFELNEMVCDEENFIFVQDFLDSYLDIIIFAFSLFTIFIKIFSYYNLKTYSEFLEKREILILDSLHEKFINDLNSAFNEKNMLVPNNIISENEKKNDNINNKDEDLNDIYIKQRNNFK